MVKNTESAQSLCTEETGRTWELSEGGRKVLKAANHKFFSRQYDYPSKARITEGQAHALIEAYIEEYLPWWVNDPCPLVPDSFKQALREIDPDFDKGVGRLISQSPVSAPSQRTPVFQNPNK